MFKNLKAILSIAGEKIIMKLKGAEFRKGIIYLHPEENENVTYVIKNADADILINNGEDIPTEDVTTIDKPSHETHKRNDENIPSNSSKETTPRSNLNNPNEYTRPFKTKMSFTVYSDERDLINRMIKDSGYNRTNYFIACFKNSVKKSVEKSFHAECVRVQKVRDERETELTKVR